MSSAEATPEAEVQGPGQAPEGASSVAHLDMDMGVAAPQPPASVGTCSVVLQLDTALPGKARADADARMDADAGGVTMMR